MKPKTLLALLVVTLGLGAFIFLFEKDLPSTDERREQAKKVLGLAVQDIAGLTIDGGEQPALRFERRDDLSLDAPQDIDSDDPLRPVEWHLLEPLTARADSMAVVGLLRQLVDLESGQRLADMQWSEAGLDDPIAEVTLHTEDGDTTVLFGAQVPASDDRIVAVAGQPDVHVAPASVLDTLRRSANEWRAKELVPGNRDEVQDVVLEAAGQRIVLNHRDGEFWLQEPWQDRADANRAASLVGALLGLRAESFLDASPLNDDGLGLEPPAAKLQITFAERSEAVDVLLGDRQLPVMGQVDDGEVLHARVDDQLVTLKPGALSELIRLPASAWRSAAWSRLEVFQIERAEITFADGDGTTAMVLARADSEWSRDGQVIDYTAVSDLLYAVDEMQAVEVVDRQTATARGYNLDDDAQMSFRLATVDGGELLTVWGGAENGLYAAAVDDRDVVLLLADDGVNKLQNLLAAVAVAEAPQAAAPGPSPEDAATADVDGPEIDP